MESIIVIMAIVVFAGWVVLRRRHGRQAQVVSVSPEAISPQQLAHKAFAHGNTCLAEGKYAEAIAAFHQAHEQNPKHPHVADRLAEVERQQRAAGVITPTNATS